VGQGTVSPEEPHLRRALVSGLRLGVPVAVIGTAVGLLAPEDVGLLVWGLPLVLGPAMVVLAAALHALVLVVHALERRRFPLATQPLDRGDTAPQRWAMTLGTALVVLAAVLSGALLLRGETLF
jgi:hypothetical protein